MNRGRNVMTVELRFTKTRIYDGLCSTVSVTHCTAATLGQHAKYKLRSIRKEMVVASLRYHPIVYLKY